MIKARPLGDNYHVSSSSSFYHFSQMCYSPSIANIEIRPCLISTYLRRSNLSWSAFLRRPIGSQKPRGGWAPSSLSKDIFKAEEAARRAGGAKAAAPNRADRIKVNCMRRSAHVKKRSSHHHHRPDPVNMSLQIPGFHGIARFWTQQNPQLNVQYSTPKFNCLVLLWNT